MKILTDFLKTAETGMDRACNHLKMLEQRQHLLLN